MRPFVILLAATLLAAADYTVDVQHSQVGFAGTSTLHDFTGTARLVSGSLHLDATAPSGTVEADAASMTTNDSGRDERMHNYVMDSKLHPRVRFDLTGWAPNATGGTATGSWTMVGVAKNVTFPVTIAQGRAKAKIDLNIRDWGIRTPRMLFITVGDHVIVDLDLALAAKP